MLRGELKRLKGLMLNLKPLQQAEGHFTPLQQKSPRREAGAFHPLEWYYDSIGCWLGVKNPGLLFLDDNPLCGLFARFRVHHFDAVDA